MNNTDENEFLDQIPDEKPSQVDNKIKEITENIPDAELAKRKSMQAMGEAIRQSFAESIVGVQPMDKPAGTIFTLRYK